jgi:hypothetical protein
MPLFCAVVDIAHAVDKPLILLNDCNGLYMLSMKQHCARTISVLQVDRNRIGIDGA